MALRIRTATVDAIGTDTGASPSDFVTHDTTLTLAGTAATSGSGTPATLNIYLVGGGFGGGNGTLVGSVRMAAAGAWFYDLTQSGLPAARNLANGTYTIRLADAAAPATTLASRALIVDTLAPPPPSPPDLIAASDSGASSTDNVTRVTTPTFSGTAEAGSIVTIYSDGAIVGAAVAAGGSYSITSVALPDGTHTITATATDAAGNTSAATAALSVTIDTIAPSAPSVPDLIAAADDGMSSTDNITSVTRPTFTGTAEPNSTIRLFDGTTEVGSAPADAAGNWSVTTAALAPGVHAITATASDGAGNTSAASAALPVTIVAAATTVANGLIAFPDRDALGNINLFLIDESGAGRTQLTSGGGSKVQPWWAPDGRSLIYEQITGESILFGDLYTINADGSGGYRIAANVATPAWSPLGTAIAFSRPDLPANKVDIWTMSPDGGNQVRLTDLPTYVAGVSPSFSPDGNYILYGRRDPSGDVALWIMNADGGNDHRLTSGSWYNLDADGNIINTANDANDAVWGPDNTIAFWAGVEDQFGQIWTIKPDGSDRRQLTHVASGLSADEPAWSPDGTRLLFTSNASGVAGTWVMNADGGFQRFLTPDAAGAIPAVPGDAAWQPVATAQSAVSASTPAASTTPTSYDPAALTTLFQDVMGRAPGTAELVGMQEVAATSSLSSLREALSDAGSAAVCVLSAAAPGDAVLKATGSPDLFVFGDIALGDDRIVGFDPASDTIRLSHRWVADDDALRRALSDSAGSTVIALGNGQSITIDGVTAASLGPGNLIIV
jgi:Tol biopolymer transport system component